jgi:hypothetical protein
MSTFFNQLSQIEISPSTQTNTHATPTPGEISAAERLLQYQFQALLADSPTPENAAFLNELVSSLDNDIEHPPGKVAGVPQSYLDGLERVPKKMLKTSDTCPICAEPFLDDPYPLVVELPCHKSHRFDLDCVGPWLRLQGTCPLDRKDLLKKEVPKPAEGEEEEEFDEMYA